MINDIPYRDHNSVEVYILHHFDYVVVNVNNRTFCITYIYILST